jgi:hypothetical protein
MARAMHMAIGFVTGARGGIALEAQADGFGGDHGTHPRKLLSKLARCSK